MSRHDTWASYLDPEGTEASPPEGERAVLDRIRGVLAEPATWSDPPDDLTSRVLAVAAFDSVDEQDPDTEADLAADADLAAGADAAEPDSADLAADADLAAGADAAEPDSADLAADADLGSGADAAPPAGPGATAVAGTEAGGTAPVVPLAPRRRRRWLIAAGSAVAAAVAAVLVIGLWPGGSPTPYPVAGTAIEPAAAAKVTVDPRPAGVAITVRISGLPPSTQDTYYAVWLRGDLGTVPVGSFHWRKSGEPIDLWSGVDPARYPDFFITRQHEGAPPTPSTETVLQGVLKS